MKTKQRVVRAGLIGLAVAVSAMSVGLTGATPAGATVVAGSGYATTTGACTPLGILSYQGAGFDAVRVVRFVWGHGWVVGNWSQFARTWNEEPVITSAPSFPRPTLSAIYIQFASYNQVSMTWTLGGEWVMQGSSYWCVF